MAIAAGKRDITGTDAHDILVGLARDDGRSIAISGGGGWDTLIAGHTALTVDDGGRNDTRGRALDIDDASLWSTAYDPLLGSTVAHTTVLGLGTGTVDWFSFTAEAGATITLDVDFPRAADDWVWYGARFELYRSDGTYVPGSTGGYGGQGIESTYPFERGLTLTVETAGTYVVKFGSGGPDHPIYTPVDPVPGGYSYLLNISVTGHAATAPAPASGGVLDGGDGDDALIGSAVADTLAGGTGDDRLHAGDGDDVATGNSGADMLQGNAGSDSLKGGQGTDTLLGGDGDDRMLGGANHDALSGGDGDDWLSGGGNADELTGGAGADTFVLSAPTASGANDTITDFASGDVVAVDRDLAGMARGTIDAGVFHLGTAAADLDDRFVFDADTGTLLFDADGSAEGAAILLATLQGGVILAAADILVV